MFSILSVIECQNDESTTLSKSFYPLRGFGLLMEHYYNSHECKDEVIQIMDYLQHLRPDWKPDENRWKCKTGEYGIEICSKYQSLLEKREEKKQKRAKSPYDKDIDHDTSIDGSIGLAAHHIIPHNVLIEFFKNVLISNIQEQQKFFFILNLYSLSEKMTEFRENKDNFNGYFNEKNIEKGKLNFNMQSFEWFPGNLMMGMLLFFLNVFFSDLVDMQFFY